MRSGRAARHPVKVEDLLRGGLAQAVERSHGLIDTRRGAAMPLGRQYHDAACCFPGEADRLGKDEASACESRMFCSMIAVGTFDMTESAATTSSNRPVAANSCSFPAVNWPARCIDSASTWAAAYLIGCVAAFTWMRSVTSPTTPLISALANSRSA